MSPSEIVSTSPRQYRVVIADGHRIVRASVRCLLESAPSISVVAEAEDGEEALSKIEQFQPDVALVDVAMPRLNGIEVVRRIVRAAHRTRVLALTAFEDGRHLRESLAAGAAGFIAKSAPAADLIDAIHVVASGRPYMHGRAAAELHTRPVECSLSIRETDVLRHLALGYSNKEIGSALGISVKTVETYKARAMEKIRVTSRVEIVRFAVTQGWLKTPKA